MVKINSHSKKIVVITAGLALVVFGVLAVWPESVLKQPSGPRQAYGNLRHKSELMPIAGQAYKILHVMSYHTPWKWTDDQLEGFQDALKDLNVDYKIVQMDSKRRSDPAWTLQITQQTHTLIEQWKPDLVFTGDDNVQHYISTHYVNSEIPFVFCAVNADPEEFGFTGSTNVTGILERMHYVATLRLLKKLVPDVRKVVILSDAGKMWPGMIERIKQQTAQFPGIEIISYESIDTFEQFQQTVLSYQQQVDAIGFLGVFEYKDENGNHVPMEQVLSWLRDHNRLPDFSFWKDRVDKGTLCGVVVSGYAQGYEAGRLARQILAEGTQPCDLPMVPTETGIPMINLEAAARFNIDPTADVLLTAEVVRTSLLD